MSVYVDGQTTTKSDSHSFYPSYSKFVFTPTFDSVLNFKEGKLTAAGFPNEFAKVALLILPLIVPPWTVLIASSNCSARSLTSFSLAFAVCLPFPLQHTL